MVVRKRTKLSRHRGSHTHGWGGKKKHRGKGSHGGMGNAGRGKHGAQRKSSYTTKGILLGHKGFKMHGITQNVNAINLEDIEKMLAKGLAEKQGSVYFLDLEKLGYNKVLGSGNLKTKVKLKAASFSEKAMEKIKEAGGEAITE